MPHIFISYSNKNHEYARLLADKLKSVGFDVWIDDRINYGEDWWATIVNAIRSCSAFIVIMSPDSDDSRWVQREVSIADNLHKPIFPLLLEGDLENSKHWLIFVRTQYVDVRNQLLPRDGFYDRISEYAPRKGISGKNISKETSTGKGSNISSILKLFEWCEIPSGKIIEENLAENGTPNRNIQLVGNFYLAKYPITNAQYQVFIDSLDGYRDENWWTTIEELDWRRKHPNPSKSAFNGDDCPRENVTWFEATAFCKWLSYKTRLLIYLPTERQRLRAVQCEDNRIYPWGGDFDINRCNVRESLFRRTTAVYKYPEGANIYGVTDLSGNVWEWVNTMFGTNNRGLYTNFGCLVCGGSWRSRHRHTRIGFNRFQFPEYQAPDVGFRIFTPSLNIE